MGIVVESLPLYEFNFHQFSSAFSILFFLSAAITSIYLLFFRPYHQDVDIPFAGVRNSSFWGLFCGRFRFVFSAQTMIDEGYRKYPNKPFRLPTHSNNRVILPQKYIEELRSAPNSQLGFMAATSDFLQTERFNMDCVSGQENPAPTKMIRSDLTRNLAKLIDPLLDETRAAFAAHLPEATDWAPVITHKAFVRIVASIAGRVFVGLPICRNTQWLETSVGFSEDIVVNAILIAFFPTFLRPLMTRISPFARRIAHHRKIANSLIAPIYAERLAQEASGKVDEKEDTYAWMLKHAKSEPHNRIPERLADYQLLLGLASIHNTNAFTVAMLFELAARPEYIGPLREEIITAIEEDDGNLKKTTLAKMPKLDSFMKECARFNAGVFSFKRKIIQPTEFSDGILLPSGTTTATPIYGVMYDQMDNPEEFDGYRWYNLRQQKNQSNLFQFVSTSAADLLFGYGTHACPGRFLAAHEIQILLIFVLLRYDFKFIQGETKPKPRWVEEHVIIDREKVLLFKKRKDQPKFGFLG